MSKSFEPIIKRQKSSLQEKNVSIKGTNDFGRSPIHSPNDLPIEIKKTQIQKQFKVQEKKVPEKFFKATKTAKLSPDVLLRLNTLKPFIEELEEMDKSTVNDMMQMLIESYVNARLTNRQREGYNQMYEHLYEHSKK
ncbi:hypothetical protein [Carnobacterium inhibens]|uniref:Uncharacterized protein n=2 Tax=Carnobacterium inhibens TaxID=147709 RepID=U5SCB7_9LACT|nr:hypothetical protein [Carnobacterium inhibens]AGY82944.1 hypothetical protein Q783_11735 [Carnobacterium inhibens subsp. gilichinskyi]MBC9826239.1 hypothetical protein [Carnobacterium inhibens]